MMLVALVFTLSTAAAHTWNVCPPKSRFAPGKPIVIQFSNFSNPKDWISIVKGGSPANRYTKGYWSFIDRKSGKQQFKGLAAGKYEVRAYCCCGSEFGRYEIRAKKIYIVGNAASKDQNRASVGGKYAGLLQRLYCPLDRQKYGNFVDYGKWGGGP